MELEQTPLEEREEITAYPDDEKEISLDDLLGDQSQQTEGEPAQNFPAGTVSAGDLISGKTATELLDIAAPAVISRVAKMFGKKIQKHELKATAEEKKIISPVMQNWLNSIRVDTKDPLKALLLVCGFVYGSKIIDLNNTPGNKQLEKQPENNGRKETRGRKPGTKKGVDFK